MQLSVKHTTHYQYDVPVDYGLQQVRLTPMERDGQKALSWDLTIEGGKKELAFTDQYNNHVELISIDPGGSEIAISCDGEIEVSEASGVVGPHNGYMPLWNFKRETDLTQGGAGISALIEQLGSDHSDDIEKAHRLSALIVERVPYLVGRTDADSTAEGALDAGGGVCQDHAHIFLTAMRKLGFPARYVSGYLMMNDRIDQDATHAWAEAHFGGIGWVGFDVSNGYSPDERYIRVATGLDYRDASPISGMRYGNAKENMVVQLQVQQ
ncbi:transglutaminase family protein [Pontixanthobacter aquaemixtae]|uniref:Transglutaminase family protein n=1 Tax=Pontixanthobacter aquaemixtae TaxID=1958940 RepID=A0A844ZX20_9SPHN|nr:transglutaminase family protein [Pontixanthobacter aquaemixtae]MXO91307.1 transglutaminase family protein [Pontixanthobacter aquaemixtae]